MFSLNTLTSVHLTHISTTLCPTDSLLVFYLTLTDLKQTFRLLKIRHQCYITLHYRVCSDVFKQPSFISITKFACIYYDILKLFIALDLYIDPESDRSVFAVSIWLSCQRAHDTRSVPTMSSLSCTPAGHIADKTHKFLLKTCVSRCPRLGLHIKVAPAGGTGSRDNWRSPTWLSDEQGSRY